MQFFCNQSLQEQFNKNGYVIVDFLNTKEVDIFLNFLHEQPIEYEKGIFSSIFHWDYERQTIFSNLIQCILQNKLELVLPTWKTYGASYIVKSPDLSQNSNFDLHQDFTMTDESYIPSFGLWVALVDTNKTNGGLCVLPGSDSKFKGTIRSVNISSLFLPIDKEVNTHVEYLEIKAGQACIFSHALFHGSLNNKSHKYRPIIHAGVFAPDAKIRHYPKTINSGGEEIIEILEISLDYYFYNIKEFIKNPKSGPYKVLGIQEKYTSTPTRDDVLKSYQCTATTHKLPYILQYISRKIKAIFK